MIYASVLYKKGTSYELMVNVWMVMVKKGTSYELMVNVWMVMVEKGTSWILLIYKTIEQLI